jgi:hypothetical protein
MSLTDNSAGVKVITRTDFSKVKKPVCEQSLEWTYRTDTHVCLNRDYRLAFGKVPAL